MSGGWWGALCTPLERSRAQGCIFNVQLRSWLIEPMHCSGNVMQKSDRRCDRRGDASGRNRGDPQRTEGLRASSSVQSCVLGYPQPQLSIALSTNWLLFTCFIRSQTCLSLPLQSVQYRTLGPSIGHLWARLVRFPG